MTFANVYRGNPSTVNRAEDRESSGPSGMRKLLAYNVPQTWNSLHNIVSFAPVPQIACPMLPYVAVCL